MDKKENNLFVFFVIIIVLISFQIKISEAQQRHRIGECQPVYGDYTSGAIEQPYGAHRIIRTQEEARLLLEKFFSSNGNIKNIRIGRIKEKPHFYEAEILNNQNILIDLIIIDKRTGRLRSVY